MLERRSLLAPKLKDGGRDGADGHRALRLTEIRGSWLTQITAFPGREAALAEGIGRVLGVAFHAEAHRATVLGPVTVLPTAPRQYWMLTASEAIDRAWPGAIASGDGSVTPISHARSRLALTGVGAREVLARGLALDLHPDVLPIGGVAHGALHHTGALLHRAAPERYELYVLSTFASSIWEWLEDASLELGYEVGIETPSA
jgi:sarcosine oxidase subunit gamma